MQNNQGDINVKLQSQCIFLVNEVTHLRGLLSASVPLDEHMSVVDELTATETRVSVLEEENARLRKKNEATEMQLSESTEKVGKLERELKDVHDLRQILEQKNCDAKSVVELLTRCIFGRSSERTEFNAMLADAVETAMDIHDAEKFITQLAGFATSAMAMASAGEVESASVTERKESKIGRPSGRRKDGRGGDTTSRNAGKKRNHARRLRHGFETVASELDERFGISYGRYGSGISYMVKQRHGRPDQWTVRIAFMSKPRIYFKEYTVANIYSRELGDDTSDRPLQLVEGCPYSASFVSYYLTMKFSYNLSENKIIRMLREMGCTVRQSTLNKWMHRVMKRMREAIAPVLTKEVQTSSFHAQRRDPYPGTCVE